MQLFKQFLICIPFLIINSAIVAQSYLVPNDEDYFVTESDNYLFIYPKSYESLVPDLIDANRKIKAQYEKDFAWQLDEKTSLVLASPQNQVANGFATVSPNNLTTYFGAGSGEIDHFAIKSWLQALLLHESAHLYQINAKDSVSANMKSVLGNQFWYFFFVHPNILLPTFFVEGNATYNESRFNNGGRLYSGLQRAMFLKLLKNGKVNWKRLMNDHLHWPFTDEKYWVGGYYNAFLAERYGQKANSFFLNQATHYINPLRINATYRENFGKTYNEILQEFIAKYQPLADRQQSSQEKVIAKSQFAAPLNRVDNAILFLATDDAKSKPTLYRYDNKIHKERINLPLGKVFYTDQEWRSTSSQFIDASHIKYSLYNKSLRSHPKYEGKIVLDVKGDDTLYVPAEKAFTSPQLYKNNEFIGEAHSTAIFDEQSNVYYFRQNGSRRELYKNKNLYKSVSFDGHSSYPVDVYDNIVYFIAPTESGSGLFATTDDAGSIQRISALDTIIDARRAGPNSFMIVEVGDDSYEYKLIKTFENSAQQLPTLYKYSFESENLTEKLKLNEASNNKTALQNKAYNSLTQLRYSSLQPILGYSSWLGATLGFMADFNDPLGYNNLRFGYAYNGGYTDNTFVAYSRTKHKLNWGLSFIYDDVLDLDESTDNDGNTTDIEVRDRTQDAQAQLSFSYPLYKRGRWRSNFATRLIYESLGNFRSDDFKSYDVDTNISVNRIVSYPLSFGVEELFSFQIGHLVEAEAPQWINKVDTYSTRLNLAYDLGFENRILLNYQAAVSEGRRIEISSGGDSLFDHSNEFRRFGDGIASRFYEVQKVSLTYRFNFDAQIYHQSFPIGLRRISPFITGTYFHTRSDDKGNFTKDFDESIGGLDFELLLAHKIPFGFNLNTILSDSLEANNIRRFAFNLNFKKSF